MSSIQLPDGTLVEIPPERCPAGHPLLPHGTLVGWSPCGCTPGESGHRTYTCYFGTPNEPYEPPPDRPYESPDRPYESPDRPYQPPPVQPPPGRLDESPPVPTYQPPPDQEYQPPLVEPPPDQPPPEKRRRFRRLLTIGGAVLVVIACAFPEALSPLFDDNSDPGKSSDPAYGRNPVDVVHELHICDNPTVD
jgi:hypothetical protein